ncbi:hypothetical protein [Actinoplanes xinjiangensis]|nr:hypothetical protein [Actinoplanes xinjiangensis]GIF42714.1 hypothetical protein Axi01nite_70250 [Actinoplanes xinjiangensis]
MGRADRDEAGGGSLFMVGLAALFIFVVATTAANIVAGDDTLRYVTGDRPVYGVASGQNGTDRWLEWRLPAGTAAIGVTYEAAEDEARRPAVFSLGGTFHRHGGAASCPARLAWDVAVAGRPGAGGVLESDEDHVDTTVPLPDEYLGLPIAITVRRVDGGDCDVTFTVYELAVDGDMPIGFLPGFPPQIFITDQCRDDEPCPLP